METEKYPLPSGWRWARLGDVLRQRNDVVHPKNLPVGEARFVGLEHVEAHTGRRIGEVAIRLEKMTGRRARFRERDIVYGYLRPYLNKVWIADFDGLCSVDQYVYSVDPKFGDTDYVASYLRSENYLALAPIQQTPGQLPRIRIDEVAATPIPLPPLPEQRRIVAALQERRAEVEAAKAAAEKQLEEVEELGQRIVDRHFGNSAAAVTLGDCGCELSYGYTASATADIDCPRMLRITDIKSDGRVDWNRAPGCAISESDERKWRLADGDILIARTGGTVGKSFIVEKPPRAVFASYLIRISTKIGVLTPKYLNLFLQTSNYWHQIGLNARGGAQPNVNATQLAQLRLPVPKVETQTQIVTTIETEKAQMARFRRAAEKQLADLAALDAALLRAAFAGAL